VIHILARHGLDESGLLVAAQLVADVVWLVGLHAVVFGIGMFALAWRLRGLLKHMPAVSSRAPQARPV
jgi:hypothetical protein